MFDRRTLIIPENTVFEEHNVVAMGDVVVGSYSQCDNGFISGGRIYVGEKVGIAGSLEAEDEVRVDHLSTVSGDVSGGGNVYLGEGIKIGGRLTVGRDLDVAKDVEIAKGFDAKGWINVRSPIPMVIYIFIYLMDLLKRGKSQEVEDILNELEGMEEEIEIAEGYMFVPDGSVISLQHIKVPGNVRIGAGSRLLGNISAKGPVKIYRGAEVYGSISTTGDINLDEAVIVHGDISTSGRVMVAEDVHVGGKVAGGEVMMARNAVIDGQVMAPRGVQFFNPVPDEVAARIESFEMGIDKVSVIPE